MKIQFLSRPADTSGPPLHQFVGYAERDDPLGSDRFVLLLDGTDAHHVTFDAYVEGLQAKGVFVDALTAPYGRMTDALLDRVWDVPTGKGFGLCVILTRTDEVAAATPGAATWSLCGIAFGDGWDKFSERLNEMDVSLPWRGPGAATFSDRGPDMIHASRGYGIGQILRSPIWGFGPEKMTVPDTAERGFATQFRKVRELDIRDMFEGGLTEEEQALLDEFRADTWGRGYGLSSHQAAKDDQFRDYLKEMHAQGVLDVRDSRTAIEVEERETISRDILRSLMESSESPSP